MSFSISVILCFYDLKRPKRVCESDGLFGLVRLYGVLVARVPTVNARVIVCICDMCE